MGHQLSQFFPPRPALTEANLESQDGRVFIVTGGYSGIGLELAKMLYQAHARVYIAGRSWEKAEKAMKAIGLAHPESKGSVEFLHLELDDLATIKASAESFLKKEKRLDVLWNNAGVSQVPPGSVSKQGIELHLATNCLGPFLFTQLLLPLLEKTSATTQPSASTRVVWTCSQIVELQTPPNGLEMSEVVAPPKDKGRNYINSKIGNWCLSTELAKRYGPGGLVSVVQNPGGASSSLFRHSPWIRYLSRPILHAPKMAAYTELYAGLSKEISMEHNGCYILPFGRVAEEKNMKQDLLDVIKSDEEGGSGKAMEFWNYCDITTREYR